MMINYWKITFIVLCIPPIVGLRSEAWMIDYIRLKY